MFKDIEVDPINGDDSANSIYKSMLVEEYGKTLAKSGGFGIADHVTRQLLQAQEMSYREGGNE
jgi:Rod binding domain-containing protein